MIDIRKIGKLLISVRNKIPRFLHASTFRKSRLDHDMTLEETSSGLCSLSYLSKVENNVLPPSKEVVDQLLKRLKLPVDIFDDESVNVTSAEVILSFLKNDFVRLKELKKKLSFDAFLFPKFMIEMILLLEKGNFAELNSQLEKIEMLAESLPFEYLLFYVILIFASFVKNDNLHYAENLMPHLEEVNFDSEVLSLFYTVFKLEYFYKRGLIPAELEDYEKKIYLSRRFISDQKLLFYESMVIALRNLSTVLSELEEIIKTNKSKEITKVYLTELLIRDKYDDILNYLSNESIDLNYLCYIGAAVFKEATQKQIHYAQTKAFTLFMKYIEFERNTQRSEENKIIVKIIDFHLRKKNCEDFFLFCRDVIFPYLLKKQPRYFFRLYFSEYFNQIGKVSRYKNLFTIIKNHTWLIEYLPCR